MESVLSNRQGSAWSRHSHSASRTALSAWFSAGQGGAHGLQDVRTALSAGLSAGQGQCEEDGIVGRIRRGARWDSRPTG
jgi:hypothetical protein